MTSRKTYYPPIEPYDSGILDVGDGHCLYWERCGSPGMKPAVFLHGGPGGGVIADHRRQWNPDAYDVLLFDQRGCGKSTPFAGLEHNDTWTIVADIERLREMCAHDTWQVFGGSWGATLALAYAQEHPAKVSEIILRGVFLARQKETDWLYRYGASEIYPEEFEAFKSTAPKGNRNNLIEAFYTMLTGDDEDTKSRAAQAWCAWEGHLVTMLPNPQLLEDFAEDDHAIPMARIAAHFFRENFWLDETQLLKNVDRIRHIPGIMVQGRHDTCTPPVSAWDLKQAWPEAELWIVDDAGHSAGETGIVDGLVRATDQFAAGTE